MHNLRNHSVIQKIAAEFLEEIGIVKPPLPIELCLQARKLSVASESLDDFLSYEDGTCPIAHKPDAMLLVPERTIWLKKGLHARHQEWAPMHELGHFILPWQCELLKHVCIFEVPEKLQREWELEANLFTAECRFLGSRFVEDAYALPFSLATPIKLADQYAVSFEATFRKYVEHHHKACCLLVSHIGQDERRLHIAGEEHQFKIQYYVSSPSFRVRINPRQVFTCSGVEPLLRPGGNHVVVEHAFPTQDAITGELTEYFAQSFTNTYKLFTLLSSSPLDSARLSAQAQGTIQLSTLRTAARPSA